MDSSIFDFILIGWNKEGCQSWIKNIMINNVYPDGGEGGCVCVGGGGGGGGSSRAVLYRFRLLAYIYVFVSGITKTYLCDFDPLRPDFYIVKLGLQGYTLFFLFLLKNIDCEYSLEPPRRGGSNEYPKSMFWAGMWKYQNFLSENIQFWWWNFQYIWIGMFS